MHKKVSIISVLLIAVLGALIVVNTSPMASAQEGEFVDNIRIEVRTSQTTGIGDTAEGMLDAFMYNVPGGKFEGLSEEMRKNLGRMKSYGSYTNLYFNPCSTEDEKYTVNQGGSYHFNPYSIQKVRYAMNWVVDRQKIVQEVYKGHAEPRYLGVSMAHPAWDEQFAPIVENFGLTPTGDIEKAKEMVTSAMESAKNDPELKGGLKKLDSDSSPVGYWWAYKGPNEDEFEPIKIGIVERLDERQQIGTLFANQVEKVGLKPEEHAWDRGKAMSVSLFGDPKKNITDWKVYTGGWGAAGAYYYNEWSAYQMYADFYGFMPGGFLGPTAWKYKTPKINEVTRPLSSGSLQSEEEYWERYREGTKLGLKDGVRVFLATTYSYYPYNTEQVTSHIEDIKTGWSDVFTPRTAKTDDGELQVAEYSDQGALFMSNWNRIAGESDVYSVKLLRMIRDYAVIGNPTTGISEPMRAEWSDIQRDVDFEDGEMNPNIKVPTEAVTYNTEAERWEPVIEGTMAASSVTYNYDFSKWHDGHMMDDQDLIGWWAFAKEWTYKDGEDDQKFQGTFSGQYKPTFDKIKGVVWHGDGEVTVYGDYTFPVKSKIGAFYAVIEPYMPWELKQAVGKLVASGDEGPETGQKYSWSKGETAWVHYLSKEQGKDFKAVLEDMSSNGEIPPYLQEQNNSPFPMTEETLSEEIEQINSFYDEYGHFYDSNGPFILTNYDPQNMVINMSRFTDLVEDANYPFAEDYWSKRLKRESLSLGSLNIPTTMKAGEPIEISISASVTQEYPEEKSEPADRGSVSVEVTRDGETVYSGTATLEEAGTFTLTIPESETQNWEAGSYDVVVQGGLEGQPLGLDESSKTVIVESEGGQDGGQQEPGEEEEQDTGMSTTTIAIIVVAVVVIAAILVYYGFYR